MTANVELVKGFCESWKSLDVTYMLGFLAEDCFFDDTPISPIKGLPAIREAFTAFMAKFDAADVILSAIAEAPDGRVLTARIDRFRRRGEWVDLPVMGIFTLVDGKITKWRDFSDTRISTLLTQD